MVGMVHSRWLLGLVALAAIECASVAALDLSFVQQAQAQARDDRFPFLSRQRPQRSEGGFFRQLFGPFDGGRDREIPPPSGYRTHAPSGGSGGGGGGGGGSDSSRPPAPRKADKNDAPPTTSIVVMGDGTSDWLAYGLEEAFGDAPEVAVVRKGKQYSGLLRYEARGDLDWWHVARDVLNQEKANYVVMMLGVNDRQNIRERDLAREADKKKEEQEAAEAEKAAAAPAEGEEAEQPAIAAPEPKGRRPTGTLEFRSDAWVQVYTRRIDDTIAALKSKGVPVFWVGLPPIRGTRSTADVGYLNDLYKQRAERAGIVYIDVWDGFVDESGKFTTNGPDYEGQMRRLRASDGVYFTRYGARKLAHYVEREIRRYMNNRALPVALPSGPLGPVGPEGPAARPLAGPVVPLTVTPGNSEMLLGGREGGAAHGDPTAARVLVKGETVSAPPGRADDFFWPRGAKRPDPAPTPVAAAPAQATPAPSGATAAVAPAAPVPTTAGAAAASAARAPAVAAPTSPAPGPSDARSAAAPAAVAAPSPSPTALVDPNPSIMQPEPAPAPAAAPAPERRRAEPPRQPAPARATQHQAPRPQQVQRPPQRVDDPRLRLPQGVGRQQQPQRDTRGGLFGLFR